MKFFHFAVMALLLSIGIACSDPTLVGGALLEQDQADVDFTDTLSVNFRTAERTSVRTFSSFVSSQLNSFLLGNYNDAYFGRSHSSIFAQVYPEAFNVDFSGYEFDSIVLILPYDMGGIYGKLDETYGIEVVALAESLSNDQDYFSDQTVAVDESKILGSTQFTPNLDSLVFFDYVGDDEIDTLFFPHLRIKLSDDFGQELLGLDTTYYEDDSLFLDYFKGIQLRPITENGGMLSFDLASSRAGIHLFLRDEDDQPQQFLFDFDVNQTVRFAHFEHDYSTGSVATFLQNDGKGDSLFFVQGMSGLEAIVEIPYAEKLAGLVVNKAELVFYAADIGQDTANYPNIEQLIISSEDEDGELVVVEDIAILASNGLSLANFFGGIPVEASNAPIVYRMNLSAYFQRMIDGEANGEKLYITPLRKAENAARSIFYGTDHPQYYPRLNLTFTRL
ncbi:MAG TPA: DUF4270 family protein [Saprospiraceae bacterium]|nr:DUF4270 family protein [Saprospiraceae bacterium]HMQ84387.1 DUF4270 family protein [Saprospiraceae bacterium]